MIRLVAVLVLPVAAALALSSSASASTPHLRPCTVLQLDLGLEGTPIARSELNSIVQAAHVNLEHGGTELAAGWGEGAAAGAVELDLTGRDSTDAVLFFIHRRAQTLADLNDAESYVSMRATLEGAAAAIQGPVPGLKQPSLLWTVVSQARTRNPTAATIAAVTAGRISLDGVAVASKTQTPPDPSRASNLATWGLAHLARVASLNQCQV